MRSVYDARLGAGGSVNIPKEIIGLLQVKEGESVTFKKKRKGELTLTKRPPKRKIQSISE